MKTGSASVDIAADWIRNCSKLFVLTGAGVSKESGIPTFRDAQEGLWADYNAEDLATPEGFLKDPPLVWQWYDWRRKKVQNVQPNPGHFALVEIEQFVPNFTLVTQNVDGLHRRAGSKNLIEIHGSILLFKCFDRGHEQKEIAFDLKVPPHCECGSMIRPAVVWFGEALPEKALKQSYDAAENCDVVLVVGTSGLVHPAASLPFLAKRTGAKIIEVNPNKTELTEGCDLFLAGPSGEILPKIVAGLKNKI